jgi:hypothetical protein
LPALSQRSSPPPPEPHENLRKASTTPHLAPRDLFGIRFTQAAIDGADGDTLWVIPDQMYFDVESVRTADDALLVVKLMVFFELADIEMMLDQTHDPIADFINAVTADVIAFVGAATFEDFKQRPAN